MNAFHEGQILPEMIGRKDGMYFDTTGGFTLYLLFHKPTVKEMDAFQSGQRAEFRFFRRQQLLMLFTRFGSLNWMEGPYSPFLSLTPVQTDNLCNALTRILIDTATGSVQKLTLFGLDHKFAAALAAEIAAQMLLPFDRAAYLEHLSTLQKQYTTSQLVQQATHRCILKEGMAYGENPLKKE